ncbi:MAG: peptidoglycan-binding domain-containing protein [Rhodospirillaceae bacterium]
MTTASARFSRRGNAAPPTPSSSATIPSNSVVRWFGGRGQCGQPSPRRPDVAKVETFLGQAGHYEPLKDGPSGYINTRLDEAIRSFQVDNGLEVDGILNPGGPTISTLQTSIAGWPMPSPRVEFFGGDGSVPDEEKDVDPGFSIPSDGKNVDPGIEWNLPSTAVPMPNLGGTDFWEDTSPSIKWGENALFRSATEPMGNGGDTMQASSAKVLEAQQNSVPQQTESWLPARGEDRLENRRTESQGLKVLNNESDIGDAVRSIPDHLMRQTESAYGDARRQRGEEKDRFDRINQALPPDLRGTHETLEGVRQSGKAAGYDVSSDMMGHYLYGDGSPKTVGADWARQYGGVRKGEAGVQAHFENWILSGSGASKDDKTYGKNADWLKTGQEGRAVRNMEWNSVKGANPDDFMSDQYNTLGDVTVKGTGNLDMVREGNVVTVTGTVSMQAHDNYDFGKGEGKGGSQPKDGWLPQGILGGDPALTRGNVTDLEQAGGATPFVIQSEPWAREVTGTLTLDDQDNIVDSSFDWKDAPQ